jgi:hypothetical protein
MRQLDSTWHLRDYLGALSARLGLNRNNYKMPPGLYHMGSPGKDSPVFVTANYKLSVDHLRRGLGGMDSHILVLDTKGVNVWCAAGKGTFGTEELIKRIKTEALETIVNHRTLILPQLGAPGMNPGEVKSGCGFSIQYGPVEAKDIPAYMENEQKATPAMRRKNFPLLERLAVSFTHFAQGFFPSIALALAFMLLNYLLIDSPQILQSIQISLAALFTGSLLAAALLPLLPGKAFSLKGFFIGLLIYPVVSLISGPILNFPEGLYPLGKAILLHCWIVYQVLNLTGSSTYTSLSGVKKEMSIAVPILALALLAGAACMITGGLIL